MFINSLFNKSMLLSFWKGPQCSWLNFRQPSLLMTMNSWKRSLIPFLLQTPKHNFVFLEPWKDEQDEIFKINLVFGKFVEVTFTKIKQLKSNVIWHQLIIIIVPMHGKDILCRWWSVTSQRESHEIIASLRCLNWYNAASLLGSIQIFNLVWILPSMFLWETAFGLFDRTGCCYYCINIKTAVCSTQCWIFRDCCPEQMGV